MPQPTPGDLHIDRALTNLSVAYVQSASNFIADKAFPFVPVEKQSDKYWKYKKGSFFQDEARRRAPGTESAGGGYELGTDSYYCEKWALHKDVDDDTVANSDPGTDPFRDTNTFLTNAMLIRRERLFVDEYMKIGVWGTDVTGNVNFPFWDDQAMSDPGHDIKTGRVTILQSTGHLPNTLVVGYLVHEALKEHPLIKENFKYTGATSITREMLARYFEVEKYLVSEAIYNPTPENLLNPVFAFITGKDALLCYSTRTPSLMMPTAGYIFGWRGLTKLNNMGIRTKRFRMEKLEAERVESTFSLDMKLVASDMGYFFKSCIQ